MNKACPLVTFETLVELSPFSPKPDQSVAPLYKDLLNVSILQEMGFSTDG